MMSTLQERFDAKYEPEPNSGCWLWTAATDTPGYGRLTCNGRVDGAHRASWMLHHGEIPEGLFVCHICDVKCCVNPAHLFLGTPKENTCDMKSKGRDLKGESYPAAKLTVLQIKQIRKDPRVQRTIAIDYGVSQPTVSLIKSGMTWGHIQNAL